MSNISMKIVVTGHVQGVGFRYFTQQKALAMGIQGYAKNLNNGSVEVVACGDKEAIHRFINWLSEGPRSATVESVMAEEIPFCEIAEFAIR